jgi:perosamine synthetase
VYARHRLDIGFADLAMAAAARGRQAPPSSGGLSCFTVRSGFHLPLEALALPAGGEVVFSALTPPDQPRLVEQHGLVAVPADLDLDTLAPRPDSLRTALSARTRIVVVAHLFGGLVDLAPIAEAARRAGALLVEDCAQAYAGPGQDVQLRHAEDLLARPRERRS